MKLRLADAAAHATLAAALEPTRRATHQQENYFFDGAAQELSSKRVVLRVRFYNQDAKAVITVKVGGWGWQGRHPGRAPASVCPPQLPALVLLPLHWVRRVVALNQYPFAVQAGQAGSTGRDWPRPRGGGGGGPCGGPLLPLRPRQAAEPRNPPAGEPQKASEVLRKQQIQAVLPLLVAAVCRLCCALPTGDWWLEAWSGRCLGLDRCRACCWPSARCLPSCGAPPARSSTGVQQLVCLGGFNNTRQEFEVGGMAALLGVHSVVCARGRRGEGNITFRVPSTWPGCVPALVLHPLHPPCPSLPSLTQPAVPAARSGRATCWSWTRRGTSGVRCTSWSARR